MQEQVHDEQPINTDQPALVLNLSSSRDASHLEQWTSQLLNAEAHEISELAPALNVFEKDFDQLSKSEEVEFISHEGVDFATYKGVHFKNSGYMRIHPNVTKSRARAKKFDLVSINLCIVDVLNTT